MIRYVRLFVALAILLSGLALLPKIGLPSERFSWQQYTGAYEQPAIFQTYIPFVAR